MIQAITNKRWDHFVAKCPICMPVSHAFLVYAGSRDVEVYPSRGGEGLPKAIQDDLKSPRVRA